MALTYITITGTFDDGSGTPLSGQVVFTPSETVYASGIPVASASNPVTVQVISGVLQSARLLSTANTGLTYAGLTGFFYWTAQVTLGGITQTPWSFFLPLSPTTVDLYALANTAASGGFTNPMTTAGDMIDATTGGAAQRLAIGTVGQILTVSSGTAPTWATAPPALPLTTLGDTVYENATPAPARLAGNTTITKNFLTQTGTGAVSAAPAWGTIASSDMPGATTSAQGAVVIDGTASDFQPSPYIAAAGSTGKAADAGHVHPFKAWQFHVKSYGAKGDGVMVSDGAMSASGTTLACTTSTPFTSTAVDGGKTVCVIGAGTSNSPGTNAGRPFVTTIATVTNTGHAVLSAPATNAVSGVGVVFGTDDTAAIQSAIAAAFSYGQVHGYAEILFDPVYYIIAGAPVVGGSTLGNSQLTLPAAAMSASPHKVTLAFIGGAVDGGCVVQFTGATSTPFSPGTVWCSLTAPATNDGAFGPACVLGGPWEGYGGGGGTFADMEVIVDAITIQPVFVTHDPGPSWNGNATGPVIGGINLYGMGWAWVKNYTFAPLAVSLTSSSSWPAWGNPNNWSGTQWQPGLVMPAVGNNGVADISRYTCNGAWAGLVAGEHCTWDTARIANTGRALIPYNPTGTQVHGINARYLDAEFCDVVIDIETSGTYGSEGQIGVQILQTDVENNVSTYLYDPGGFLYGGTNLQDNGYNNQNYFTNQFGGGGSAVNFRLIFSTSAPGPVLSPHAVPATGAAWLNGYYRDAWVTVALSSAHTFTSLSIDSTAQPNAAGGSAYTFLLPSGHSYTPVYGTVATLTHTVTLL